MTQSEKKPIPPNATAILDAIADGVYVTDTERRIIYWNKAAENITGWTCKDILGEFCGNDLLCHVDRHSRPLCGKENCPLHRSIVTNSPSRKPMLIFARTRSGKRVPVQVTVSPLHDEEGNVIGGVEVFREITDSVLDLQRAKKIQTFALKPVRSPFENVHCTVQYSPHDVIGGDFYALERIGQDRCVCIVADVMGHGVSSALYTMYIRSIWEEYFHLLSTPDRFLFKLNNKLEKLLRPDHAFATAFIVLADFKTGRLYFIGAGHPPAFLFRDNNVVEKLVSDSPPLGISHDTEYRTCEVAFNPGETLLIYTDGATELWDSHRGLLGDEGFLHLLQSLDYPCSDISFGIIEQKLLEASGEVQLLDDLTLLEISFQRAGARRGNRRTGSTTGYQSHASNITDAT